MKLMTKEECNAFTEKCNKFIASGMKLGSESDGASLMLGGEVLETEPDGTMVIRYEVLSSQRNSMGNMQGGMLISVIDNSMALISICTVGSPILTINLETSFLAPIGKDVTHVILHTRIEKQGKTSMLLTCSAYRPDGVKTAISTSNVMVYRKR